MKATFVQPLEEWRGLHFIMQDDKVVFTRLDASPLGYESEDIVGSTLSDILAPECVEEVTNILHNVLKTHDRQIFHYRTLGLARDGSRLPMRVAVWATTYHDKPAVGGLASFGINEDPAGPLPCNNSDDYQSLWGESAKAGEGIAVFENDKRKDLRCIYANDEIERLSGYSSNELMGLEPGDLFILADDAQRERSAARFETAILCKDGGAISVEICMGIASLYQRGQVAVIYVRDITERKAWETETLKLQESLRFYASQVVKAQEDERKRLSRELHDGTIQTLVVIADRLRTSERVSHDSNDDLYDMMDRALRELRSITWRLRPPFLDAKGLPPALEWLAGNISREGGPKIDVAIKGQPRRLSANIELSIFRIVQEAISNVYRHAQASTAEVILEFAGDKVLLSISDNGCGFELPDKLTTLVETGRLGLIGMNERCQDIGATIMIESEPGRGTRIRFEVSTQAFL